MDSDFKRFDGASMPLARAQGLFEDQQYQSRLKFHYQIKLTNNTGIPIGAAYGNNATAIITVPWYVGLLAAASPAVVKSARWAILPRSRGLKQRSVWPGYHDRDDAIRYR